MMTNRVFITECPRDAMQGIHEFIPTDTKVTYLNHLLRSGFDVLDIGSFVSPKAIPQMKDTAEVLAQIVMPEHGPELLVIVANQRGAQDAVKAGSVTYLGYPFSISETFQQRNTNASITESLERVKEIKEIADEGQKKLLIYISMAFGNPYNDPYDPEIVMDWLNKLGELGVTDFAMADTVGVSTVDSIKALFSKVIPTFPTYHIGAHLHSKPEDIAAKVVAAYESGCRRFDGAIRGYGGCPMANDDLVGNVATEVMVKALKDAGAELGVNEDALANSLQASLSVF